MKRRYYGINIWNADDLPARLQGVKAEIDGRWVAARPMGWDSIWFRLKCAWRVFRMEADILLWYKQ